MFLADRRAPASGRRAPAAADICPVTGRGRLSYPRAESLFKQATAALDPHKKGWTLHQLRHSALQHLALGGRSAPELQAKSRHQHLASLGRYVRLGEQTSAQVTADADPAADLADPPASPKTPRPLCTSPWRLDIRTRRPPRIGTVDGGNSARPGPLTPLAARLLLKPRAARIGANSPYVDPPRYLGAALGSATITPNGDGSNGRWTPTFPFSKAVPTCAITIRSGTTVVRTLNCATSTGRAVLSWDARNSAGKLVAKGKYQWTMTGRDADGTLRWWTGSTAPITSTVTVA